MCNHKIFSMDFEIFSFIDMAALIKIQNADVPDAGERLILYCVD